jgi:hypothetical protein
MIPIRPGLWAIGHSSHAWDYPRHLCREANERQQPRPKHFPSPHPSVTLLFLRPSVLVLVSLETGIGFPASIIHIPRAAHTPRRPHRRRRLQRLDHARDVRHHLRQ